MDWNATINCLRESLPQAQFHNWFKPVEFIRCNDRAIVLGVPSRFHGEWLRSHYGNELSRAIEKQTGAHLQLEFEILAQEKSVDGYEPTLPLVPVAHGRPNLRVISSQAAVAPEEEPAPAPAETPNFPTFTNPYIELDFNHVSYQCSLMFSVEKQPTLNPLVLHGGIGMGKTHLLSEIGRRLHQEKPGWQIRYTNFEAFTAEMVGALKSDNILSFKRKYREQTNCLLFDDVQGLTRRMKTQEELLHIYNEMVARGGRIVFTSSIPIHRLEDFIEPLKSRLLSGLITEIKTPNFEEKVKLLSQVSQQNQIIVEPTTLRTLADQGQKDIRELIGSLFRLHLQAKLENRDFDKTYLAEENWVRESQREAITMKEIISLVEHHLGVSRDDLASKSRKGTTSFARQVAMYLARHFTLMPLGDIGRTFGRDHATVIHACQKIKEAMELLPTRRYEVEFLVQKLQGRSPRPPAGGATDVFDL